MQKIYMLVMKMSYLHAEDMYVDAEHVFSDEWKGEESIVVN